ncbi:hypothetical protein HME9304_01313 [Flagellimonas maritima]|uniref:DUF4332 domain-containing protein n=1 Tax=Flagellimonas maritima TaxID=1383885 RepID=A0A2Z4LR63_9FLAO|nr:hypothetical protein [Allomuricauda aurantiaca]AWX44313.1 hypothetical protein HME9304_01313 [Allomuricauda aurantiaca]
MDFENINISYLVIAGLASIISGVLGYLIGKSKEIPIVDNSAYLNILEIENAKLRADLEICTKRLSSSSKFQDQVSVTSSTINTSLAKRQFDSESAKIALGKKIKMDDLKIVEGIGPKIEGLFHKFNIKTWEALSETTTDKCQEVLNSGGDRYRIHDPASWPMQAKMAFEGLWKELAEWQDKHKSGKF